VTIQDQAIRELMDIIDVYEVTPRRCRFDLWREKWLHRVCIQVSIREEIVADYPEHAERMKESAREELAMSLATAFEFQKIGLFEGDHPPSSISSEAVSLLRLLDWQTSRTERGQNRGDGRMTDQEQVIGEPVKITKDDSGICPGSGSAPQGSEKVPGEGVWCPTCGRHVKLDLWGRWNPHPSLPYQGSREANKQPESAKPPPLLQEMWDYVQNQETEARRVYALRVMEALVLFRAPREDLLMRTRIPIEQTITQELCRLHKELMGSRL
jgi:hypothetical protein